MTSIKGDTGGAFFFSTGSDVHRTGFVTTDQEWERAKQLHAVRVLAKHDALDLLDMLFRPPTEVQRQSTGRATESA